MKTSILAALFALSFSTAALAAPTGKVYETVDNYQSTNAYLLVTGIEQGTTTSATTSYFFGNTGAPGAERLSCERFLLLAMNHPGRYYVTMTPAGASAVPATCTLTRR
jgi:hypothetical protein